MSGMPFWHLLLLSVSSRHCLPPFKDSCMSIPSIVPKKCPHPTFCDDTEGEPDVDEEVNGKDSEIEEKLGTVTASTLLYPVSLLFGC